MLLYASKSLSGRGEMTITHANELVMEVFEVTGFADILNIV